MSKSADYSVIDLPIHNIACKHPSGANNLQISLLLMFQEAMFKNVLIMMTSLERESYKAAKKEGIKS